MIRATYSALILLFIAMAFISCKFDRGLSAFNQRKYTPGYFADKTGSKQDVLPAVGRIAVSPKQEPAVLKSVNSVVAKLKLVDSVKPLMLNNSHIATTKALIKEAAHNFIHNLPVKDSPLVTSDNTKENKDKYVLIEIGLMTAAIALMIVAFPFLSHPFSLLLYTLFMVLSVCCISIVRKLNDRYTNSTVINIIIDVFIVCYALAFLILVLAGYPN